MISWIHTPHGQPMKGSGNQRPECWTAKIGRVGMLTVIRRQYRNGEADMYEVIVFGVALEHKSPDLEMAQRRAEAAAKDWVQRAAKILEV